MGQLYHEVLENASKEGWGLSFDDVLIVPKYSNVRPTEPDVSGRFSKNTELKVPIVSSPMDTVTEDEMAKAVAFYGGIGVIHRNLTPEDQSRMVEKVKRSGYVIHDPVTVEPEDTLDYVSNKASRLGFQTFPVVKDGKLCGIVTGKDMRLGKLGGKTKVKQIMTENPVYVPVGTSREKMIETMCDRKVEKLLILDESGKLYGLMSLKDIMSMIEHPDATRDPEGRLRVAAAVGVIPGDEKRIELLYKAGTDVLVVDSSHGYCDDVIRTVKWIKSKYGDSFDVVAGNVVSPDGAVELAASGADGIKVGIGVGRTCITRNMTGVGMPQLSSVYSVKKALLERGYNDIAVIADGGIKEPADIAKVLASGADSVMTGSTLGGTEEAPGEMVIYQGRKYKKVRGMGSQKAQQKREQLSKKYGSNNYGRQGYVYRVPEGVEGLVPFSGSVVDLLEIYVGGLKSSMAHVGARNLGEFQKYVKFIRVTSAGKSEGKNLSVILDEPLTGA